MLNANEFPSTAERERLSTLTKYSKLYDNEQFAVLGLHDLIKKHYKNEKDIIYLCHAIPARITEFYGDFVAGDIDRLIIQSGTENKADEDWVQNVVYINDLKEETANFAEEQSQYGYTALLGWVDGEGNYHIDSIPADQYFPQRDGSVIFATYKKDPADQEGKKMLLLTQHYRVENGSVILDNQAWRLNSQMIAAEPYPLEQMAKILGRELLETQTIEGIDELPIRQIDNGRRSKYGFGVSDYHKVLPQLSEINERATHASTVFLKNIDAKMVVPASSLEEDEKTGEVELRHQEVYVQESKEDPTPSYIVNTNPLLADLREHVMSELKFIEWVTGVPMWALTKGSAQVEKVESLRIQLFAAVRKTAKKRAKIKRALLDMFRIGAKMTGQSEELQNNDIVIEFSDVLPVDEMVQVETESVKVTSGLSSKKRAIMRIENYTDEEAQDELDQIAAEDQIAGLGNPNNAPTL